MTYWTDLYLIHYGRSKKDGAPGVGTGNWKRTRYLTPENARPGERTKAANDISRSLTKQERIWLMDDDIDYVDDHEYYKGMSTNVYSLIKEYGGVPVSAIDVWEDTDNGKRNGVGMVSILVRNDERFRHQGQGQEAVENMLKWFGDSKLSELEWGVFRDNERSRRLAERNGFKLKQDDKNDNFVVYSRKK